MRLKAKLTYKYEKKTGVSEATHETWQRQDMKWKLLDDDGTEKNEELLTSCSNQLLIDAPALSIGATGLISVWFGVREYNGRGYQGANLQMFTPQTFLPQSPVEAAQQQQQPAQAPQPAQQTAQAGQPDLPF